MEDAIVYYMLDEGSPVDADQPNHVPTQFTPLDFNDPDKNKMLQSSDSYLMDVEAPPYYNEPDSTPETPRTIRSLLWQACRCCTGAGSYQDVD